MDIKREIKGEQQVPVILKLTPNAYKLCAKWASVGRSIDIAVSALCEAEFNDKLEEEMAIIATNELNELKYLLDTLHQQTRSVIWVLEKDNG